MSSIRLKSDELTVTIETLGAEIISVKDKNNKEYIWEADPEVWENHAPVLFPIVSRLIDGKYTYQGIEYSMPIHGFARFHEFDIENKTENSITFLLRSSEETLKMYPFVFEFRVCYTLNGRKISIDYITSNKTKGNMYYSVGGHEGYAINGGIENYSIVLDNEETLSRYEVQKVGGISENPTLCFNSSRELKLDEKYFEVDAIIFLDMKSDGVALRDDRNGDSIHVSFPGFDSLLIWKKPNAEYVCIEPWAGGPNLPWKPFKDFSEKYRIRKLKEGESEKLTHIITF